MAYNWQSGDVLDAATLNARGPQGILGQVSPTDATTTTTTEAFRGTITANLRTSRWYMLQYWGAYQSSVALDFVIVRLRRASGASVTSSGTLVQAMTLKCETASANQSVAMGSSFTVASTGQWTVGVSIARTGGTGNVKLDYGAGLVEPYLLLTDIGPA